MDYTKIKEAAQAYLPAMTKFLRDLIAIPSESCEEDEILIRKKKEEKRNKKWNLGKIKLTLGMKILIQLLRYSIDHCICQK